MKRRVLALLCPDDVCWSLTVTRSMAICQRNWNTAGLIGKLWQAYSGKGEFHRSLWCKVGDKDDSSTPREQNDVRKFDMAETIPPTSGHFTRLQHRRNIEDHDNERWLFTDPWYWPLCAQKRSAMNRSMTVSKKKKSVHVSFKVGWFGWLLHF